MPSIASSPASTAGSTDLESGHVTVSASTQRWCSFTLDRSCFRTLGLALDARPRTLPNRGEVEAPASLRQNSQLSTSATIRTTRERDPSVRSSRAPRRESVATRAVAPALAPRPRLLGTSGMRWPPHLSMERRASEPRSTDGTFPERCKTARQWSAKDHRSSLHRVRGGTPNSTVGCAEDG